MRGKSDRLQIRGKSELEINLKLSAAEAAKGLILTSFRRMQTYENSDLLLCKLLYNTRKKDNGQIKLNYNLEEFSFSPPRLIFFKSVYA